MNDRGGMIHSIDDLAEAPEDSGVPEIIQELAKSIEVELEKHPGYVGTIELLPHNNLNVIIQKGDILIEIPYKYGDDQLSEPSPAGKYLLPKHVPSHIARAIREYSDQTQPTATFK